jgi:hypothetical protein
MWMPTQLALFGANWLYRFFRFSSYAALAVKSNKMARKRAGLSGAHPLLILALGPAPNA